MQMDVKDMSIFPDDSFESVIDKGKWISSSHMHFKVCSFVHLLSFDHNNILPDILRDLLICIIGTLDSLMVS